VRTISRRLGYRRGDITSQRFGMLFNEPQVRLDINGVLVHELSAQGLRGGTRFEFGAVEHADDDPAGVDRAMEFCEALDGVLLNGAIGPRLIERLRAAHVPHVVLGHTVGPIQEAGGPTITKVVYDDVGMGYVATRALLDAGHQRLGFISEIMPRGLQHDRWRRGYQLALLESNQPVDPELIVVTGQVEVGAEPALETLLALERPPTAYVVPDTRLAATLVTALMRRGVNLPKNALVFAGVKSIVSSMRMHDYPHLMGRCDLLAEHGLSLLSRLCRHPNSVPVEVLVPFEAVNFIASADQHAVSGKLGRNLA
jgi:hypothetical protein